MFETATLLTGLPGAVLAVWVVLIVALFLVTRGLSRSLAWTFVAAGIVIPAVALHFWPLGTMTACTETVLAEGDSADGHYAYRIVQNQCRGSSELAWRVDMGRKLPGTYEVALRPVMRSYGFPRPVAVRQVVDNHFLIFLTSNGRDQVPLRISLDPATGEPSYVHRFFQGHSDRSFTVSDLSETAAVAPARPSRSESQSRQQDDSRQPDDGPLSATVTAKPDMSPGRGTPEGGTFRLRLMVLSLLSGY